MNTVLRKARRSVGLSAIALGIPATASAQAATDRWTIELTPYLWAAGLDGDTAADGTGSEIWDLLVAGLAPDEIADRLRSRYDAPPGAVERAVAVLVDELRREGLVAEADAVPGDGDIGDVVVRDGGGSRPARVEFEAPLLHRYTDMADFMLVDPIHEVEESGWPNRKVAH